MLRARGIDLIAADSPTSFLDDTPTARLIRQVLGAVSEFEKAMLVAKLRGARDRKRRTGIKVEGRKSIAERQPETVELGAKSGPSTPQGRQAFSPRGFSRTRRGRSYDQDRQAIRGYGGQAHVEQVEGRLPCFSAQFSAVSLSFRSPSTPLSQRRCSARQRSG